MGEHFDLYFAGWYNDDMMKIIIDNDYNQLLSNINERDQIYKYIEAKKIGWKGKLLIDSGAFSIHKSKKEVPLQDYIDFLNANHEYLDYYIQLDDIPGEWGRKPTPEEVADSPKKTWEGFIGGVVFSCLLTFGTAMLLTYYNCPLFNKISLDKWYLILIISLVIPFVGTLGDLFFSSVKRHFDIKDFGVLLKSHGGVLDRMDSILFACIVGTLIVALINIF